jgi:hypothetical protein
MWLLVKMAKLAEEKFAFTLRWGNDEENCWNNNRKLNAKELVRDLDSLYSATKIKLPKFPVYDVAQARPECGLIISLSRPSGQPTRTIFIPSSNYATNRQP